MSHFVCSDTSVEERNDDMLPADLPTCSSRYLATFPIRMAVRRSAKIARPGAWKQRKSADTPVEHALLSSERVSRGEKFQPRCAWRRQPDSHDSTVHVRSDSPVRIQSTAPIFFEAQHSPFSHYHNPIHRRPSLSPPIINPSYAHPFYPILYMR